MMSRYAQDQEDHAQNAESANLDGPQPQELPENEVIARALHGDARAFERLYRLHSARVYAICLRMTGNPAEADDLVQEAFLMVFRKICTFRGESAFSTWLHRIAINLTLMRKRKKTLVETSLQENSERESDRSACPGEIAVADPFLTGTLDRLYLERALQDLHPFQKLVVVLHDIQGYKHREIAKILNCTIGNSKARLHRARAHLRKLLQKSLGVRCVGPSGSSEAAFSP